MAAANGESHLAPSLAARLVKEVRRDRDESDVLSRREQEVLALLARGRSNKIAHRLSIGDETVKSHVSNILSRLNRADRRQAAIYALPRRLVPLDSALEADREG